MTKHVIKICPQTASQKASKRTSQRASWAASQVARPCFLESALSLLSCFGRIIVQLHSLTRLMSLCCGAILAVCGFRNALWCNLGCLWFWKRVVLQFGLFVVLEMRCGAISVRCFFSQEIVVRRCLGVTQIIRITFSRIKDH